VASDAASAPARAPAADGALAADEDAAFVDDGVDEADDDRATGDDDEAAVVDGGAIPERGFGTAAMALAVVVGLLLGFGAGWLFPRLTTPGDRSVEAGFARDMINHHAQAVEMGLIAFQRAQSPEVRQLGVDIATAQQGEIGTMQTWLRRWRLDPTGSEPAMAWMPEGGTSLASNGLMPGIANADEMKQLREARSPALDVLFLQLMIRHHLGGVHMVDAALAATDEPEVVQVAQTMRNTQQTELTNLRAELTRLGGTTLPAN